MSTQTHANAGASGHADLVIPTTRMLAIGRLTEAGKSAARFPIMPSEVRETIRLHLTGKIDQWFIQTEGGGSSSS
jgi:Flp pilus assembly protein CpaB